MAQGLFTYELALIRAAKVAYDRITDCYNCVKIYDDMPKEVADASEMYQMASNNLFEALLIFQRIKELAIIPIDWEAEGLHIKDK